jgi:hypothetical protein
MTQAARFRKLVVYIGEPHCFLVCRTCHTALPLSRIPQHFSNSKNHNYERQDCIEVLGAWKALYSSTHPIKLNTEADLQAWAPPSQPAAPIPHLSIKLGFHCRLSVNFRDTERCPAIFRNVRRMKKHCMEKHGWRDNRKHRGPGRPSGRPPAEPWLMPWESNVHCQQMVWTGYSSEFWRVYPAEQPGIEDESASMGNASHEKSHSTFRRKEELSGVWDRVEAQLDSYRAGQSHRALTSTVNSRYPIHFSPWLDKTGWAAYLADHDPQAVAQLLESPDQQDEPGLHALILAFDALIAAARESILSEEINVFALHRVNSFLRGRPYSKPFHSKLLDGTYRNYRAVWHKLLCFTYRLVVLRKGPRLHYKLTPDQLHAFSQVPTQNYYPETTPRMSPPAADAALEDSPHHPSDPSVSSELQNVCLQLCLSLLDHKLHGKLTDSIVVGFLAALGINKERNGLDGAAIYTSKLSALVKLAQLLVVQHAVLEHRAKRVVFPNEMVAELQDRFMVYGSDTPMNWILNLRAYGKKERDNTTTAGHIVWSDDGEQLSYRTLDLTMNELRWFLRDQVELAQNQLHDLLLLPVGGADVRQRYLPTLQLSALKDDPTVRDSRHSFLCEPRNQHILGDKQRYILHQIRSSSPLARRFFTNADTLSWDQKAVRSYRQQVNAFLRRILLLFHMAGGQPARGTELLILRWRNSDTCDVRNITIENGLVCFVTSYHKNYSTTNSTKIIHRYLPPEVSELVVYYLWLVVPFLEQLSILNAVPGLEEPGSFLWPANLAVKRKRPKEAQALGTSGTDTQDEPWDSSQLGEIIAEEMKRGLKTKASISLWRHTAIAISRRHLPEGQYFKRDYGQDKKDAAMDLQAAHTSRMAGSCYARDIREARGHIASIRAEYRQLSRSWHACLGFGVPLPPRMKVELPQNLALAAGTKVDVEERTCGRKRSREELEKELNEWIREESVLRVKRQRLPLVSRLKCKDSMENIGLEKSHLTEKENVFL